MTIAINPYIAEEMPQNVPVWVFQGGARSSSPTSLPQIEGRLPFRLLYAGKLNRLNCIDQILELVSKSDDLHLTLFGDGELDGLARSFASRFQNIEMRGLCPHADVMASMREAHGVLSMRRLDDGYYKGFFPSKIIEMLASPSHVLVSRMGRVTENLDGAVIFIEGSSSQDLLAAIKKTKKLDKKDIQLQLERRRILLDQIFNWRRLAEVVQSGCLK